MLEVSDWLGIAGAIAVMIGALAAAFVAIKRPAQPDGEAEHDPIHLHEHDRALIGATRDALHNLRHAVEDVTHALKHRRGDG